LWMRRPRHKRWRDAASFLRADFTPASLAGALDGLLR
jgi:hypothetical protein